MIVLTQDEIRAEIALLEHVGALEWRIAPLRRLLAVVSRPDPVGGPHGR